MINICVMSRNRFTRLMDNVERIIKNTEGVEHRISLLFDDDAFGYGMASTSSRDRYNCFLYKPQQECVKMTNNCYKVTKALGCDLFCFLNDDMEVQPGWLKAAKKTYDKAFPDGMGLVGFNCYAELPPGGDSICCAGLTSVRFIEEESEAGLNGVFFDELYVHNEADGDLTYRAMLLNKWAWSRGAKVQHRHVIYNPELNDTTYSESHRFFRSDLDKRVAMFKERGWTDEFLKTLLFQPTHRNRIGET